MYAMCNAVVMKALRLPGAPRGGGAWKDQWTGGEESQFYSQDDLRSLAQMLIRHSSGTGSERSSHWCGDQAATGRRETTSGVGGTRFGDGIQGTKAISLHLCQTHTLPLAKKHSSPAGLCRDDLRWEDSDPAPLHKDGAQGWCGLDDTGGGELKRCDWKLKRCDCAHSSLALEGSTANPLELSGAVTRQVSSPASPAHRSHFFPPSESSVGLSSGAPGGHQLPEACNKADDAEAAATGTLRRRRRRRRRLFSAHTPHFDADRCPSCHWILESSESLPAFASAQSAPGPFRDTLRPADGGAVDRPQLRQPSPAYARHSTPLAGPSSPQPSGYTSPARWPQPHLFDYTSPAQSPKPHRFDCTSPPHPHPSGYKSPARWPQAHRFSCTPLPLSRPSGSPGRTSPCLSPLPHRFGGPLSPLPHRFGGPSSPGSPHCRSPVFGTAPSPSLPNPHRHSLIS